MRLCAAALLLGLACQVATGAEVLRGQVTKYEKEVVEIAVEGNLVPRPGDAVEVYIEIPDMPETAWVCSASVSRVEGGVVYARVTERSADPHKGDLARITSENPVPKR